MKTLIAALTAAAVLAGLAVPANAETSSDKQTYATKTSAKKKRERQVEHIAERQRIGTKVWWEQMDREDRGGRRR